MTSSKRATALRNDLRTVSIVVLAFMLLSLALEVPPRPIPEEYDFSAGRNTTYKTDEDGEDEGTIPVPEEIEVVSRTGTTSEGYSSDEPFSLSKPFVSRITVELTWTDDIGSNDKFGITLERNGDAVGEDSGTAGSLSIEVRDETLASLAGDYVVVIEALSCPGAVGPFPVDRDTGNSWELKVAATVADEPVGGD